MPQVYSITMNRSVLGFPTNILRDEADLIQITETEYKTRSITDIWTHIGQDPAGY